MNRYMVPENNAEGYPDPTAESALRNIALRDMQRRQQGRRRKIAGEHFEEMIDASMKWYEERGQVCAEKTPEPMKPLGHPNRKGQFLACYTKAAQPDFQGTLAGGRSVVFEAKHTDTDRIEYSRLTQEQVERLERHHNLGAVAFVAVSFGLQHFYRIPWEVWRDMKKLFGHKHMKQQECEPYRVQYMAGVIKLLEGMDLKYGKEAKAKLWRI